MKRWLALVSVAVLAACGGSSKPATLNVQGKMTLAQSGVFRTAGKLPDLGQPCIGKAGFDDLTPGAQVKVTDEKNTVLATAQLGTGTLVNDSGGFHTCEFPFTVAVPDGKAFYQFEVSHRGVISFSHDDLKAKGNTVALTLG